MNLFFISLLAPYQVITHQEELKKIKEEMRLTEEALQKELQEHEQKIKQLNDRLLLEKKLHEEEVRRMDEENRKKKELSAAKIQAHFRGMRWLFDIFDFEFFYSKLHR